ncbi:MAG: hypothetical protein AAF654_14700 [Myxococcota bacterium]
MAVQFPDPHVYNDEGFGHGVLALAAVQLTSRQVESYFLDASDTEELDANSFSSFSRSLGVGVAA